MTDEDFWDCTLPQIYARMRIWRAREQRWDDRVKFIASYAGHVDLFASERDQDHDIRNGVWSSQMTDEQAEAYFDQLTKYVNQQPTN